MIVSGGRYQVVVVQAFMRDNGQYKDTEIRTGVRCTAADERVMTSPVHK